MAILDHLAQGWWLDDLLGAMIEIITTRDSFRIQKPATQIPHQSQHRDLEHKNGKKDRCLKMEGVEGDHMKIQWKFPDGNSHVSE
jgi:Co/Zn/Cd efflux system component